MFAPRAFFSFTEVPDPQDHRAYNEWHQLDHRPENLLLPGVAWGERWVRSPDCADAGTGNGTGAPDPTLARLHYLNMYWFREPVAESSRAWSDLGERSFQWGRRGDVHIANRLLTQFFRPVKGYVVPRVSVSAEALAFRPNRGVHLEVTRVDDPHDPAAERLFGWYDTVRIPDLLGCAGAAGAWTFASESTFTPAPGPSGEAGPAGTRILLVFLDGDPRAFAAEVGERAAGWRDAGRLPDHSDVEATLFSGPLRAITPWEWDWFDA
jgi:hypothetical protein